MIDDVFILFKLLLIRWISVVASIQIHTRNGENWKKVRATNPWKDPRPDWKILEIRQTARQIPASEIQKAEQKAENRQKNKSTNRKTMEVSFL